MRLRVVGGGACLGGADRECLGLGTVSCQVLDGGSVVPSADALEEEASSVLVDLAARGESSGFADVVARALAFERTVEAFRERVEAIFDDVDIDGRFRAWATLLTEKATRVAFAIAASERTAGRMVGYPIFDDRIAHLRRDDGVWVDFVNATFRTFGGSAQFVAVREGLVVYRQKSLDFDPTPVVGAGAALAKLGLRVAAAQVAGKDSTGAAGTQSRVAGTAVPVGRGEMRAAEDALRRRLEARVQALDGLAVLLSSLEEGADATALTAAKLEYESIVNFYQGLVAASESGRSGGQ